MKTTKPTTIDLLEPIRKNKWAKQNSPYYTACLRCDLSCTRLEHRKHYKFDIFTCPRLEKGELVFKDEWDRQKREYDKSLARKGVSRIEENQAYFE